LKVKALVSFGGNYNMTIGEEKEIKDKTICDDLIQANYVIDITPEKKVKAHESK